MALVMKHDFLMIPGNFHMFLLALNAIEFSRWFPFTPDHRHNHRAHVYAISPLLTTLGKLATKKDKARCSKVQQLWWVALACCWAGVQVYQTGQGAAPIIHEKFRVKFLEAVNLICH